MKTNFVGRKVIIRGDRSGVFFWNTCREGW